MGQNTSASLSHVLVLLQQPRMRVLVWCPLYHQCEIGSNHTNCNKNLNEDNQKTRPPTEHHKCMCKYRSGGTGNHLCDKYGNIHAGGLCTETVVVIAQQGHT